MRGDEERGDQIKNTPGIDLARRTRTPRTQYRCSRSDKRRRRRIRSTKRRAEEGQKLSTKRGNCTGMENNYCTLFELTSLENEVKGNIVSS